MHTNRERAATLLRAERRVQEREKWLEGEQQELDQTRDRVSEPVSVAVCCLIIRWLVCAPFGVLT